MQNLEIRVLFMGNNLVRLLGGLWITIRISLIAIALSIVLGILLGMVMALKHPLIRLLTRLYLEYDRRKERF